MMTLLPVSGVLPLLVARLRRVKENFRAGREPVLPHGEANAVHGRYIATNGLP